MFIFKPTTAFSNAEAQQLYTWVRAGNVVVYATEEADLQLDTQFGLHRSTVSVTTRAHAAAPILGGVNTISGASSALTFKPSAPQVPLLRNAGGDVAALRTAVYSGQVLAMTNPLGLCNGYLRLAANGRSAPDMIAPTPPARR